MLRIKKNQKGKGIAAASLIDGSSVGVHTLLAQASLKMWALLRLHIAPECYYIGTFPLELGSSLLL